MSSTPKEGVMILILSLTLSVVLWWSVGAPDRSVRCLTDEVPEGEVCLESVLGWEEGSYLWVDARTRKLWKKNGVPNSVLLTDDRAENYDDLLGEFLATVFNDGVPYQEVVLYCNQEGCGASKAIARQLRQEFAQEFGFKVHVLFGGWQALAAEGLTGSPASGR